jgi:hypothetical protein
MDRIHAKTETEYAILPAQAFLLKTEGELERNVWCLDLVPTLFYLTGWPVPKNAEGAVIYQAPEDPDMK